MTINRYPLSLLSEENTSTIRQYGIYVFFFLLTFSFLYLPIVAYDTDLWYHLKGGRFFFEHKSISESSYYSFIVPTKYWLNHFWLFQVIVYTVYSLFDYYGLIVLRSFIFILTTYFIFHSFYNKDNEFNITTTVLAMLCILSLIPRDLNLRPHMFTYLFSIFFIFTIEKKQSMVPILLLAGVLWCNIHGIEYVVMIIILGSYLIEELYLSLRGYPSNLQSRNRYILIAALYTILITPYGIELIPHPFKAYSHVDMYISEFRNTTLNNILTFTFYPLDNISHSLNNILYLAIPIALIFGAYTKTLRISHLIMLVCGIILFTKGDRFSNELVILSIPILSHTSSVIDKHYSSFFKCHSMVSTILSVIILIIPFIYLSFNVLNYRAYYPFSRANLPVGNAKFLNYVNTGGTVLNNPNTAGYLEWILPNTYAIHMDLITTLFDEIDYTSNINAVSSDIGFTKFYDKYKPSYISVPINNIKFRDIILNYSNYQLVSFDEYEVLYVDSNQLPNIAEQHKLNYINPYRIDEIKYDRSNWQVMLEMLTECLSLRRVDPDNGKVNAAICFILHGLECYEEALPYADKIIEQHPNFYLGYTLKAQSFIGMHQYKDALLLLKKALSKNGTNNIRPIYTSLFDAYININRYEDAYKSLLKIVNPFNPNSDYKDIIRLGLAAGAAGRHYDATTFLKIAEQRVPPDDFESINKIQSYLKFDSNDAKNHLQ